MNIRELLNIMVKQNSSDVYITVESPPMFRTEGITKPYGDKQVTNAQAEEIAASIMTEKQKIKFAESLEMNLALYYPELGRFRVNILRQKGCTALVIRQIKMEISTVDELGLPSILKDVAMCSRGLVLVVGRTGTGKSTTLAGMIDHRNENATGHIITIEDPIEFIHAHKQMIVSQRELGLDTLSVSNGLKNAMRAAPDVILVGEIRDTETMEAAITFAETGHLVLATLHSNNANQAMERILNFFPHERHEQILLQLSLNLKGIISQRLIPSTNQMRVAATEILLDTPRVKDLIYKNKIDLLKEAMAQGTVEGMHTFDQSLFNLYKKGLITYDSALSYADSVNDLRLRIKIDEVGDEDNDSSTGKKSEDVFRLKPDFQVK
ncbi:MAG: PilT/PilU family type 4a pilus ATPase [Thermodesulfobacteriota bacterium]|nr:PilT/PilU family type 4a pilus ATPase [Thermodesulfobacteriota bacterium]